MKKVLSILGIFFSITIFAALFYVFVVVKTEVPKPFAWPDNDTFVFVCPGMDIDKVIEAAELLPFEFFLIEEVDYCVCPEGYYPSGVIEVYTGEMPEHSEEGKFVGGLADLTYDEDNFITGVCVLVPEEGPLVIAHELAHACGYMHAKGGSTGCANTGHVMNPSMDFQAKSTYGMDLDCDEFNDVEWIEEEDELIE